MAQADELAVPVLQDQLLKDRSRVFQEFLDVDDDSAAFNYKDAVKRMLRLGERRLIVNLDDLRDYNRAYCDG